MKWNNSIGIAEIIAIVTIAVAGTVFYNNLNRDVEEIRQILPKDDSGHLIPIVENKETSLFRMENVSKEISTLSSSIRNQENTIGKINKELQSIRDSIGNKYNEKKLEKGFLESQSNMESKLKQLESTVNYLNEKLSKTQNSINNISTSAPTTRDPVNELYGIQELSFLEASITKLVINHNHDVVAFFKYKNKSKSDYLIGLSGCATNWRKLTYVVDDAGNIYTIKTASGIGYVGCHRINDPVFLKAGENATFTIVFGRPRSVEKFGTTFSLSSAQHRGRINADGKWKDINSFNISIGNIRPDQQESNNGSS